MSYLKSQISLEQVVPDQIDGGILYETSLEDFIEATFSPIQKTYENISKHCVRISGNENESENSLTKVSEMRKKYGPCKVLYKQYFRDLNESKNEGKKAMIECVKEMKNDLRTVNDYRQCKFYGFSVALNYMQNKEQGILSSYLNTNF